MKYCNQFRVIATALLLSGPLMAQQDVIGDAGQRVHSSLNQWADDWSPIGWIVAIGSMFFGSRGRHIGAAAAAVNLGLTHIDRIHGFIKGL